MTDATIVRLVTKNLFILALLVRTVSPSFAAPPPAPEGCQRVKDGRFSDESNGALLDVRVTAAQPAFLPGEDPKSAGRVWKQVPLLSDEFDGSAIDRTKWQDEPVANGWNWYGRAPGLFRAENVQLNEGKLCVTVSKLDAPVVRDGKTFTHQGAIVRSLHPGRPGWYFECRMKANATVMSSTFWLMAKDAPKKRLELDIQECVGLTTDKTAPWGKKWDHIFHSNLIQHKNRFTPEKVQLQDSVPTETKNWERYYVYGAWWKSPEEVQFYLDGKYVYSIKPQVAWDVPAFIQMAVEIYDWNPVPEDGGLVDTGTWEQRTTQYDWVRTWELVDEAVASQDASPAEGATLHFKPADSGDEEVWMRDDDVEHDGRAIPGSADL